MESLPSAIERLMENNDDFQQKFKQRLVRESINVVNPIKFIAGLLTQGILKDESSDSETVEEFKAMMVQFALKLASSKGADGVRGLLKALDESGNILLVAALRNWVEEDFGVETHDDLDLSEQTEGAAALPSEASKPSPKSVKGSTQSSSTGIKSIDKITSRPWPEADFTEKLQRTLTDMADQQAAGPAAQLTAENLKILASEQRGHTEAKFLAATCNLSYYKP